MTTEPEKTRVATTEPLSTKDYNKSVVKEIASSYGWDSGAEWAALEILIYKESSWNHTAQNPSSTAFGLFQFLNQTWLGYGCTKSDDVSHQAECGMKYIANRYGSPSKALSFHRINNWY